jgi:hypothetical protein
MVPSGPPKVLVFGSVRSGTTWTSQILAATGDAQYFNEPDTVAHNVYALKAVRHLDVDPVLGADDVATPPYERLWDTFFGAGRPRRLRGRNWLARRLLRGLTAAERRASVRPGGPPASWRQRLAVALAQPPRVDPTRAVVVKSVSANFALEWVLARWRPTPVWVRRHPMDAVASRIALPLPTEATELWRALQRADRVPSWCPPPPDDRDSVAVAAWLAGAVMSTCREVAARRDDVVVVDHEALCREPVAEFRALSTRLGFAWTERGAAALAASNQPGEGWSTRRVTAEQPGRWRTRLAAEEQERAIGWLAKFPIVDDYPELRAYEPREW